MNAAVDRCGASTGRRTGAVQQFSELRTIIERHGGTAEKFIGDAVMAVFEIPRIHANDALRAVRAAAEIRERMPAVGQEVGLTAPQFGEVD